MELIVDIYKIKKKKNYMLNRFLNMKLNIY